MQSIKKTHLFDMIAKVMFMFTIVLLPIFFIPLPTISIQTAKGILIPIGILGACICWLIARIHDGNILLPQNRVFTLLGFTALITFISALASPVVWNSFFGTTFSLYTTGGIFLLLITICLGMVIKIATKEMSYYFMALLAVSVLIGIFQLILLFVGGNIGFAQFTSSIDTTLGSMSDIAIFYGSIAILLLLIIELVPLSKVQKSVLAIVFGIALFFLLLSNVLIIWIMVGIFSFGLFIFRMTIDQKRVGISKKQLIFPTASFVVILVALMCVVGNNFFGPLLGKAFGITSTDIRPSFEATVAVTLPSLNENPVFGAGPNRFGQLWTLHQPSRVSESIFSDIPFTTGYSYMTTLISTTGIFGFLCMSALCIYFFYLGGKKLFSIPADPIPRFMFISTFVLAVYFWISLWFYAPSVTNILMVGIFTGLHLGIQCRQNYIVTCEWKFMRDSKQGFVVICSILLLLLMCVTGLYIYVKKAVASAMLTSAIVAEYNSTRENIETTLHNVANLEKTDLHYRSLAQYYTAELTRIPDIADATEMQQVFKTYFSNAEVSAQKAITLDSTNYLNWTTLALVYQTIVPLHIDGAYEKAFNAYQEALQRNPNSPELYLNIAKLELIEGNTIPARELIQKVLSYQPNATNAYLLLSQIEVDEGNITSAITQAKHALFTNPTNTYAVLQLGFLYFSDGQYLEAQSYFEHVLTIAPTNVDARYFLALTFEKLGDLASAKNILEILHGEFPQHIAITTAYNRVTTLAIPIQVDEALAE